MEEVIQNPGAKRPSLSQVSELDSPSEFESLTRLRLGLLAPGFWITLLDYNGPALLDA